MSKRKKLVRAVVLAATVLLAGLAAQSSQAAGKQFAWLCKPGLEVNPCMGERGGLLTERVTASGQTSRWSPKFRKRIRNRVDCFYVYPTVSGQPGPNADLTKGPEILGIAQQQAARFAPGCRMFAPVYRQFTVSAIFNGQTTAKVTARAYNSVRAAFGEYLRRYNKGRGIVLIGHSQGSGHLNELIADTFDKRPRLRKRLVSAVLIGGNVTVAKGRRTGGSFRRIPACARARELGCVIAYSGFLSEPPPPDALFGRVGGALSDDLDPDRYEVMCVNPARLDGSRGRLRPLYNTAPFPGIYGPLLPDFTAYDAPWVSFPNLYRARCRKQGGASWLAVEDISGPADSRPRIGEPLGRTWGTHLTEVNDAAGNLVRVVMTQERTYVKRLVKQRRAKAKRKARQRAKLRRRLRLKRIRRLKQARKLRQKIHG